VILALYHLSDIIAAERDFDFDFDFDFMHDCSDNGFCLCVPAGGADITKWKGKDFEHTVHHAGLDWIGLELDVIPGSEWIEMAWGCNTQAPFRGIEPAYSSSFP
jgi:hypothetical protein